MRGWGSSGGIPFVLPLSPTTHPCWQTLEVRSVSFADRLGFQPYASACRPVNEQSKACYSVPPAFLGPRCGGGNWFASALRVGFGNEVVSRPTSCCPAGCYVTRPRPLVCTAHLQSPLPCDIKGEARSGFPRNARPHLIAGPCADCPGVRCCISGPFHPSAAPVGGRRLVS